ncbi:MAG: pseudouridine synthase [Oscillospiraceae bacterium]
MAFLRLDKILSEAGVASRREAKAWLKAGRVTVDGTAVHGGEKKFDPGVSVICVDGHKITHAKYRYFIMNKPVGVITATEDRSQETVIDLLPPELRRLELFPVGRLDKDTSGLLILTNDGAYAHSVISPKKHVAKVYLAGVDAPLQSGDALRFSEGIVLADGTECLPGSLEILSKYRCRVTIHEGKYHQVRRMLAACGKHVLTLHREAIGGLRLDEKLPHGEVRELLSGEREWVFL